MPCRAEIEIALWTAVENEPSLDAAGLVFANNGVANILRYPAEPSDPYIYCSAGPDIRTAAPDPPLSTEWRAPWPPSYSRFDVPHDLSTAEKKASPETTHDLVNFGLDLVVLGLGIGVVVMTGGVGALGVWAGVQLVAGGALAINDSARTVSDFIDHGAIGHFEDNDPQYKSYFKDMTDAAIIVQFLDGDGLVEASRGFDISKITAADMKSRLFKVFAPLSDWGKASDALGKSKLGLGDALKGDIGPGQRVRLGTLLDVGGRKAKIEAIRKILALRIANDFGASLITIGQASFGGPISDIYEYISNFQFSLLFFNDKNTVSTSYYGPNYKDDRNFKPEGMGRNYPHVGPHPF
ncbi:MAG: hypothetical protein PHT60_12675 [Acidiphilium sp.]|nr:hypothetical protein [Acidiphilium sp.]MDD4936614.1 hypothetical protein [Acidiphilium sp.]